MTSVNCSSSILPPFPGAAVVAARRPTSPTATSSISLAPTFRTAADLEAWLSSSDQISPPHASPQLSLGLSRNSRWKEGGGGGPVMKTTPQLRFPRCPRPRRNSIPEAHHMRWHSLDVNLRFHTRIYISQPHRRYEVSFAPI